MLFRNSLMLRQLSKQGTELAACEGLLRDALEPSFLEGPSMYKVGLPFGTRPVGNLSWQVFSSGEIRAGAKCTRSL